MTRCKGFTLVEVLTSIVILSFATGFIFHAFFTSLSSIDEAWDRLVVMNSMKNDISRVKIGIAKGDIKIPFKSKGMVELYKKPYEYAIYAAKNSKDDLMSIIKVSYFWHEGKRELKLSSDVLWIETYQGKGAL